MVATSWDVTFEFVNGSHPTARQMKAGRKDITAIMPNYGARAIKSRSVDPTKHDRIFHASVVFFLDGVRVPTEELPLPVRDDSGMTQEQLFRELHEKLGGEVSA